MAKKKNKNDKPQVINNIQELNLEIDYDRLAKAMVKAQVISEDEENKKRKFTSGSFSMLIMIAFYVFSVLIGFLSVLMIFAPVVSWNALHWNGLTNIVTSIVTIAFCIVFAILLGLYAVLLWKSAKEIETEKDRNYIISVFSGIVSFAALIVALVALFKGVG